MPSGHTCFIQTSTQFNDFILPISNPFRLHQETIIVAEYNSDTRYVEEVPAHPIMGVLVFGMIGLIMYLGVMTSNGIPQKLLVLIIMVLGFIYANFMKLEVTITSTSLKVGFGIIKHSIKMSNIESIKVHSPRWYWYGGFGIRFGWDWSIGFIQNYRTGVLVKPRRGRKLFFSTNHPEEIVNLVNDLTERPFSG